ncbi:hypothetical protein K439DRAFT_391831 [Ramaria rubella]|nr:hypothetical protein K439DRAFT_391831 [Ramaria rubella]
MRSTTLIPSQSECYEETLLLSPPSTLATVFSHAMRASTAFVGESRPTEISLVYFLQWDMQIDTPFQTEKWHWRRFLVGSIAPMSALEPDVRSSVLLGEEHFPTRVALWHLCGQQATPYWYLTLGRIIWTPYKTVYRRIPNGASGDDAVPLELL